MFQGRLGDVPMVEDRDVFLLLVVVEHVAVAGVLGFVVQVKELPVLSILMTKARRIWWEFLMTMILPVASLKPRCRTTFLELKPLGMLLLVSSINSLPGRIRNKSKDDP